MAGTIFAGGRVSSFHLTSLARHSVRRPPRRFPRPLEGLDSLRASGRVEQASQPNTDVRRAAAPTRPAALLLFQICTRNRPRHQHHLIKLRRASRPRSGRILPSDQGHHSARRRRPLGMGLGEKSLLEEGIKIAEDVITAARAEVAAEVGGLAVFEPAAKP